MPRLASLVKGGLILAALVFLWWLLGAESDPVMTYEGFN